MELLNNDKIKWEIFSNFCGLVRISELCHLENIFYLTYGLDGSEQSQRSQHHHHHLWLWGKNKFKILKISSNNWVINSPKNHLKNILSHLCFGWKRAEPAKSASSSSSLTMRESPICSIVAHFEAIWKKAQYTDKHILSSSQPPSPSTKRKHKQLLSLYMLGVSQTKHAFLVLI